MFCANCTFMLWAVLQYELLLVVGIKTFLLIVNLSHYFWAYVRIPSFQTQALGQLPKETFLCSRNSTDLLSIGRYAIPCCFMPVARLIIHKVYLLGQYFSFVSAGVCVDRRMLLPSPLTEVKPQPSKAKCLIPTALCLCRCFNIHTVRYNQDRRNF